MKKLIKQNTDDETTLNPASLAAGFTQSEMVVLDNCAEKWYRGYNQMIRKKGEFHWHNVYGTAVHDTLDSFYRGGDGGYELATLQFPDDVILTNDQEKEQRYYEELLRVQMERYCTYNVGDLDNYKIEHVENIVTVQHEGINFSGKLDLVVRYGEDNFGPWDHKTSSMFTSEVFAGWDFRFQFLFYAWLMWKADLGKPNTIWWNGIRKPQLRQGKTESFESFIVRIEQAMIQEPEKYFIRRMLPMEDGALEHFEKRILGPKLNRLRLLTQPDTSGIIIESLGRNMNTSECVRFNKVCEFLPLCKSGWKAEGMSYTKRETKHEELETE